MKTIAMALPKINNKFLYIACILCFASFIFLGLIFYVIGINDLTEGSYLVKKYQKEVVKLSSENANLETEFSQIGFLGSVQERAKELSFAKALNVKYIQVANRDLLSSR